MFFTTNTRCEESGQPGGCLMGCSTSFVLSELSEVTVIDMNIKMSQRSRLAVLQTALNCMRKCGSLPFPLAARALWIFRDWCDCLQYEHHGTFISVTQDYSDLANFEFECGKEISQKSKAKTLIYVSIVESFFIL